MRAALGDQLGPALRHRSPMRLSITAPPRVRPVKPGGRPQIARICCSNCDVTAPSIVQWPLLWTRGAISLTSGPSREAKNSTVSTPTWPSASAMRSAASRRFGDLRRELIAAWHGRAAQDAVAMLVLRRVPEGVAAVVPAREDDRELGEEVDAGFGDRRLLADRCPRRGRSASGHGPRPGPCRHSHSAGVLSTSGQAEIARPPPGAPRATQPCATARPERRIASMNSFSRRAVLGDGERAGRRA